MIKPPALFSDIAMPLLGVGHIASTTIDDGVNAASMSGGGGTSTARATDGDGRVQGVFGSASTMVSADTLRIAPSEELPDILSERIVASKGGLDTELMQLIWKAASQFSGRLSVNAADGEGSLAPSRHPIERLEGLMRNVNAMRALEIHYCGRGHSEADRGIWRTSCGCEYGGYRLLLFEDCRA